jgi:uncharacterized protein YegP (UPF0339 family)
MLLNRVSEIRGGKINERKTAAGGQFMFNLKAANHQIIGTSETYKSEASRDAGIASVKINAPDAKVDDQT